MPGNMRLEPPAAALAFPQIHRSLPYFTARAFSLLTPSLLERPIKRPSLALPLRSKLERGFPSSQTSWPTKFGS
jgi:hypothetical protein